jgi:hypothetical protein
MNFSKASKLIIFLVFSYTSLFSQSISIGTNIGGGVISSNSPGIGSFTSSFFVEGGITRENYIGYRLAFFYSGDFSGLLPDDRSDYNPFIKGVSLKFIHSSDLGDRIFFEQGLGAIALNDRVFSDRDRWGYGFAVSLIAGKDLRDADYSGFKLGFGAEYGLAFTPFSANYLSLFLHVGYFL